MQYREHFRTTREQVIKRELKKLELRQAQLDTAARRPVPARTRPRAR